MANRKRSVSFVYKKNQVKWGSTIMRAHMMARMAGQHLSERYDFRLLSLPARSIPGLQYAWARLRRPGDVLIFTKHAMLSTDPGVLEALRRRGVGVCLDHVDANLAETLPIPADVHIACSFSSVEEMEAHVAKAGGSAPRPVVKLLHHNVDERIYTLDPCQQRELRGVYFGRAYLTVQTPAVERHIDFIDASDADAMERGFRALPDYNLHYCVRSGELPLGPHQHKPFTKGFTAAACGAVVLLDRQVEDALAFLGADYPYFVERPVEAEILAGLDRVADGFGCAEWQRACEIMAGVADQVSPQALAEQLAEILEVFD
ncbi:MAG: hypothetical protein AAF415_10870 [Pseudomonadota bacterium]